MRSFQFTMKKQNKQIAYQSAIQCCICLFFIFFYNKSSAQTSVKNRQSAYYFSAKGNDKNNGSVNHPLKTLSIIKTINIKPGDSILLKGGETFNDSLIISTNGTMAAPVLISSYGNSNAVINAADQSAVIIFQSSFIDVSNIICKGSGRKNGNKRPGILISDSKKISVTNLDISGFQKSGLQLYNCKHVIVDSVIAHDNGAAGIGVEGDFTTKKKTKNIQILNCNAINNPGDPTNLTNHSGNGIIVGHCTNVLIDHCLATNNGWDMPRIGNGPVGIWAYEADSVIIQHCIAYKNKTAKGAADGGGFDFDGGVTNSIIQYCLSYKNQGSGYCIFQYWGASPWHDNIFRFNISVDDGLVSDSRAGVYVWNSSNDSGQFYNCNFYNNTIYNTQQAALCFSSTSAAKNFRFMNNIFVGTDSLIRGDKAKTVFLANDWYCLKKKFYADGIKDFNTWISKYHIEQLNGKTVGLNVLPDFVNKDSVNFTDVKNITSFNSFKIKSTSPVTKAGIDLQALYKITMGNFDFNAANINIRYLGACTNP